MSDVMANEKDYPATCECMSCVNGLALWHCETVEQVCCGSRYPIQHTTPPAQPDGEASA